MTGVPARISLRAGITIMKGDVFNFAGQYIGSSGRAALCKELADEWVGRYSVAGTLTPELEAERDRIIRLMLFPQQQTKG